MALIESSSSYPVTLLYVAAFLLGALRVLNEEAYSPHFLILNHYQSEVNGAVVACDPEGGCC